MAISMLKIRRPLGRLIFNMGIAIPGKTVFLIETAPCFLGLTIVDKSAASMITIYHAFFPIDSPVIFPVSDSDIFLSILIGNWRWLKCFADKLLLHPQSPNPRDLC